MTSFGWFLQSIVVLAIAGVIVWLITSIPQIPGLFKTVIYAFVAIALLVWVLKTLVPLVS